MEVYATDFGVVAKDDASPVTVADERAEALIVAALRELAPAIPIVAEEAVGGRTRAGGRQARSGSSIRSTAPRNSSSATASSRSTSR